jgi:hypothetical protein
MYAVSSARPLPADADRRPLSASSGCYNPGLMADIVTLEIFTDYV